MYATSGCYDILHSSHIKWFEKVYELSNKNKFVVFIDSDDKMKKTKRIPIMNENERKYMVENQKYVEKCIIAKNSVYEELEKIECDITFITPHEKFLNLTLKNVKVIVVPEIGIIHTSDYIRKIKNNNYDTLSEAYINVLTDVLYNYENKTTCIDPNKINRRPCYEKFDYVFTINKPDLEIIKTNSNERNMIMEQYFKREKELFDKGDIYNLHTISTIWKKIKNPDGETNNANYGYMVYHLKDAGNIKYDDGKMLSQFDYAYNRLVERKSTKQAIIQFHRPIHQFESNLDIPCNIFLQFYIINDKLHLKSHFRSNDLVYGTPYNIMYFFTIYYNMYDKLKKVYPNLEIGPYRHEATSLHIYEAHVDKVKQMIYG
jgi:cytidyltransferase-like protein